MALLQIAIIISQLAIESSEIETHHFMTSKPTEIAGFTRTQQAG
jgi:hypothetical protein